MSAINAKDFSDLGEIFDGHIEKEFADRDVDATMKTMVLEPYVHCVPIMTGGFGGQGVRRFYSEHFVNQIPKDATVTPISRTVGKDQVVDELIVSFTHDTQWDYLLPGIPPTGKHVDLPHRSDGFSPERLPAEVASFDKFPKSLSTRSTFDRQFLRAESMSDVSRVIFHLVIGKWMSATL